MQQSTGQYAGGSLYASSDIPYPSYMASYGSAPPAYYAENARQIPPPQPSLADSMASLNISSQGTYAPNPVAGSASTYVHSYDQSYVPTGHQGPTHLASAPNFSGSLSAPPSAPYGGYDPMQPLLMGSYSANQPAVYDPSPSGMGSYETTGTHVPASKADYGPSSSGGGSYGSSQHGMQGYEYSSNGLAQAQTGMHDQGGWMYAGAPQAREFEMPVYSETSSYDSNYHEKPVGHDRVPTSDFDDVGLGEVYAYDGGNIEPYGARGTGTGGSWGAVESFSSSLNNSYSSYGNSGGSKLPKAVPMLESEDKSNGVQKYSVKLLSDASSSPQDVLCQIGLDGVRMITPSTSKIVRIYPLETITRWEVNEPSIFTFWAKSPVDVEPRRIRLQSGSYTTNAILDTLTAACVQFSEMVDKDGSLDPSKTSDNAEKNSDEPSEKKVVTFANWVTLRSRQNAPEEKQHWVPDEAVTKCSACSSDFGAFLRRHHCRNCGDVFCDKCTQGRTALTADEDAPIVRVCDRCLAEVTQRLSNAKEISSKPVTAPRSHEDLAKKLQEEMERNSSRRSTTSNSNFEKEERSGHTTVLNCSACGSIALVNGSNTRCPTCGVDSSFGVRSGKDSNSSSKGRARPWSSSDGSGKRMQEVACPTCTVHLQVQVPTSGTETVECGVCQHPFLVSAH